jgi:Ser/Thr protein kinase RdoA (MazF antagonist)
MLGAPLDLSDDSVGLVYAHIAERFAQDNPVDAEQVGSALRSIHDALAPIVPPAKVSRISEQWRSAIAGLGEVPILDPLVDALVVDILSRWDLVAGSLDRDSQLIHNDYHRGNVLMGAGGVAAVLDFDDAIAATGSTLIDIAIGLERFCLAGNTPELGAQLVTAFMAGYGRSMSDLSARGLELIATARLLFSLGILHDTPRPDDPGWRAEDDKFKGLLQRWPAWRQLLIAEGSRP